MGRRPVGIKRKEEIEVFGVDKAPENAANGMSPSASTADCRDQVTPPEGDSAETTAVEEEADINRENKGEATQQSGSNPLMGLVYYGSDSDEEGSSARDGSSPTGSKENTDRGATADAPSNAAASESPVAMAAANTTEDTELNLPNGWQQCMDNSGAIYFWNPGSGETTWEMPAGTVYRKGSSTPASSALSSNSDVAINSTPREAVSGANDGDRVASDGTSDTASESGEGEEENGEMKRSTGSASATLVSSTTTEDATGALAGDIEHPPGPEEVSDSVESDPLRKSRSQSDVDDNPRADVDTSVIDDSIQAAAGLSGVDDLLADIEAEMLSGIGGGAGRGADDADKAAHPAKDTKPAQEDFSPLREIASGLDVRAQRSHAELIELFTAAEEEDATEVGRKADGTRVKRRLRVELGAVLQARISDWREGGLDGAFLVRKLEEMAVQARSSLLDDRVTASSSQADEMLSLANSSSDEKFIATAAAAVASSNPPGEIDPPSDAVDGLSRDQEKVSPSKPSLKNKKERDKPKKGRWRGGGGGLIQSGSVINWKKEENGGKEAFGSNDRGNEGHEDSGRALHDAASENSSRTAAEALREAETAEKLRWADKVSAAATAAVAAAAKAKKEAVAREKAMTDRRPSSSPRQQGEGENDLDEILPSAEDEPREEGEIVLIPKASVTSASTEGEVSIVSNEVDAEEDGEGDNETIKVQPMEAQPAKCGKASEVEVTPAGKSMLPSGWAAIWDNDHSAYYYHNLATDETTWVLPRAQETKATPAEKEPPAPSSSSSSPSSVKTSLTPAGRDALKIGDEKRQVEEKNPRKPLKRWQKSTGKQAGREQAEALPPMPRRGDGKTATLEPEGSAAEEGASAASTTPVKAMASGTDKSSVREEKAAKAVAPATSKSSIREKKATNPEPGARHEAGELPRPWVPVWDNNQNTHYYYNSETNKTSWVRPSAPSPVDKAKEEFQGNKVEEASPTLTSCDPAPPLPSATVDMRPSTLVWWSDAGDVWNGESLSGLLVGYGPRRYRNLGGGYYMITLELGTEWAAAAIAALGQGADDPVSAARVDWVCCIASAPGYGLFLRWAGDDDEKKLFDVPDELFDDPQPDPAVAVTDEAAPRAAAVAEVEVVAHAAALAEVEAAKEDAEANEVAAAAVAATEAAEAAGSEAAAKAVAKAAPFASTSKKRRNNKSSGMGATSGSISKKRKGAASLIDKWKAVASNAGEEAEREAEKMEKMERWKARAAALDPDNPNFIPLGRKRR